MPQGDKRLPGMRGNFLLHNYSMLNVMSFKKIIIFLIVPPVNWVCETPSYYNGMLKLWFFFCGAAAQCGPWPPHSWGFEITHNDASQSVGLLWTSDQLVAETSTWQHTTLATDNTSMPPVGFEPTISAGERPQTYALDRAATETGVEITISKPNKSQSVISISNHRIQYDCSGLNVFDQKLLWLSTNRNMFHHLKFLHKGINASCSWGFVKVHPFRPPKGQYRRKQFGHTLT